MVAGETIANATVSDLQAMALRAEKEAITKSSSAEGRTGIAPTKFVAGTNENNSKTNSSNKNQNGEIDIDDIGFDVVEEKAVPKAVYGSVSV